MLLQHFGILDSLLRVHPLMRTYMFSCVAYVWHMCIRMWIGSRINKINAITVHRLPGCTLWTKVHSLGSTCQLTAFKGLCGMSSVLWAACLCAHGNASRSTHHHIMKSVARVHKRMSCSHNQHTAHTPIIQQNSCNERHRVYFQCLR